MLFLAAGKKMMQPQQTQTSVVKNILYGDSAPDYIKNPPLPAQEPVKVSTDSGMVEAKESKGPVALRHPKSNAPLRSNPLYQTTSQGIGKNADSDWNGSERHGRVGNFTGSFTMPREP